MCRQSKKLIFHHLSTLFFILYNRKKLAAVKVVSPGQLFFTGNELRDKEEVM